MLQTLECNTRQQLKGWALDTVTLFLTGHNVFSRYAIAPVPLHRWYSLKMVAGEHLQVALGDDSDDIEIEVWVELRWEIL